MRWLQFILDRKIIKKWNQISCFVNSPKVENLGLVTWLCQTRIFKTFLPFIYQESLTNYWNISIKWRNLTPLKNSYVFHCIIIRFSFRNFHGKLVSKFTNLVVLCHIYSVYSKLIWINAFRLQFLISWKITL